MTGRAMGYCAGYAAPGFVNPGIGRGFGAFGRGRGGGGGGYGRRNMYYATGLPGWQRAEMGMPAYGGPQAYPTPYAAPFAPAATAQQELDALKGQAEYFEHAMEDIRKRIDELQAQASEKAK